MTIVLFGLYGLGVEVLERLIQDGHRVDLIITKPDDPGSAQPVAIRARKHGIPCLQPISPSLQEVVQAITAANPDLILVAGYHKPIPTKILVVPRKGTINLHTSLLPTYRGPCPHKWVVLHGRPVHGVSAHVMTPDMDDGAVLLQRSFPIGPEDSAEAVFQMSIRVSVDITSELMRHLERGNLVPLPQDPGLATYFGYPSKEDTRLRFDVPALEVRRRFLAFGDRPGVWIALAGHRYVIQECVVDPELRSPGPGRVLEARGAMLTVACLDVAVRLKLKDEDLDTHISEWIGNSNTPVELPTSRDEF